MSEMLNDDENGVGCHDDDDDDDDDDDEEEDDDAMHATTRTSLALCSASHLSLLSASHHSMHMHAPSHHSTLC
eukprot:982162-Rhodomonas_salina.1